MTSPSFYWRQCLTVGSLIGTLRVSAQSPDKIVPDTTSPLAKAEWIADAAAVRAADALHWTVDSGAPNVKGPFPLLRKEFSVSEKSPVTRATLVITALGSYQARVNGKTVSPSVLTPDWTDYRRRLLYQTFDVTQLVRSGSNAIGVLLGEGWYGSPIVTTAPYPYGPPPVRVRCALQVTHADGTTETVVSDSSWRTTEGPIIASQLYEGETFDARRIPKGWDRTTFDDQAWTAAQVLPSPEKMVLEPQESPTIQQIETLRPARRIVVSRDTTIYDFGQNMVGWVRLRVRGPKGATVQLRHTEALWPDGRRIRRDNLREAEATDRFTLAGVPNRTAGAETFEPHFTYHGFRYVEVVTTGGARVEAKSPVGVVIHTASPQTATFESSNASLNRLWQNIHWSFRGNLTGVPTDCPQRSERLAWLGDAAAFWPTAVYLRNVETFTRKWMQDLRDGQAHVREVLTKSGKADMSLIGCFPAVSPPPRGRCGGPGWSDAGVLVPYATYRQYGDTATVRAHWNAMEAYMTFISTNNPMFRWTTYNQGYGDWLPASPTDTTGKELIATVFWAADALAMQSMARGLGDTATARRYGELYANIRKAFQEAYIDSAGVVGQRSANGNWLTSQTSDVLALAYGLIPDTLRRAVTEHLVARITANKGHLGTGFLGTSHLLPALTAGGRDDIAYQLLLTTTTPSWLAMVAQGATTMWEHWDSNLSSNAPDALKGSLNHYAYGAVGEWLLRDAVGITQDTGSTGFQRIVIHPRPDPLERLTRMAATYDSPVGPIASAWTIDPKTHAVALTVTIPKGAEARIDVPVRDGKGYRYVSHTVTGGTHRF